MEQVKRIVNKNGDISVVRKILLSVLNIWLLVIKEL